MTYTAFKSETETHVPVKKYVEDYCTALTENYKQYNIAMLKRNLDDDKYNYPSYAKEQLDAIDNGTANLRRYRFTQGKRYYKVVAEEYREENKYYNHKAGWRDTTVEAFVDMKTGEVYKPAGWSKPAKHVRFDMRIIRHREFLHNWKNVDWAGGHLYMR